MNMMIPLEEFDWSELLGCRVETPNERERDTGTTTGEETVVEFVITADAEVVTQAREGGVGTWGRSGGQHRTENISHCISIRVQCVYTCYS